MSDPNVDAMENRDRAARRETERSGVEGRVENATDSLEQLLHDGLGRCRDAGCRQCADAHIVRSVLSDLRERLEEEKQRASEFQSWGTTCKEERDEARRQRDALRSTVREAMKQANRLYMDVDDKRVEVHATAIHDTLADALDGPEGEEGNTLSFSDPSEMRGLTEDEAEAYREIKDEAFEPVHGADADEGYSGDHKLRLEHHEGTPQVTVDSWQAHCSCGWSSGKSTDRQTVIRKHAEHSPDAPDQHPTDPPDEGEQRQLGTFEEHVQQWDPDSLDDQPGEDGVGEELEIVDAALNHCAECLSFRPDDYDAGGDLDRVLTRVRHLRDEYGDEEAGSGGWATRYQQDVCALINLLRRHLTDRPAPDEGARWVPVVLDSPYGRLSRGPVTIENGTKCWVVGRGPGGGFTLGLDASASIQVEGVPEHWVSPEGDRDNLRWPADPAPDGREEGEGA